jgi:cyclic pyranopterin monophosphate synthase
MTDEGFTHLDSEGRARMVDVGEKPVTERLATAEGWIRTLPETAARIDDAKVAKGNVLVVAELAGIMAGKRTADWIPLCHPLALDSLRVELHVDHQLPGVRARATARVHARTGVEMEALTAVSASLLTVYDMCKSADRGMVIGGIRLIAKEGGRSGSWSAENQSLTAR